MKATTTTAALVIGALGAIGGPAYSPTASADLIRTSTGGTACGDPALVGTWEQTTGATVTARIELNDDCTGTFRQWAYGTPASDGQFQRFEWSADADAQHWSLDYTYGVACDFTVGIWEESLATDSGQPYQLESSVLVLGTAIFHRKQSGDNGNPRAGGGCTKVF